MTFKGNLEISLIYEKVVDLLRKIDALLSKYYLKNFRKFNQIKSEEIRFKNRC